MVLFISYALALILTVKTVSCLQCYTCDSMNNKACIRSFKHYHMKCEETAKTVNPWLQDRCYTLRAKNKEGEDLIARGCLDFATNNYIDIAEKIGWIDAAYHADPGRVDQLSCETCETDLCNYASTMTGLRFLGLCLTIFAFLV